MKNNLPLAALFLVISRVVVLPAGFTQPTPAFTPLGPDRFHVLVLDGFGEVLHRSAPRPTPTPTPPQLLTVMLPGDVTMDMVLIPAGSFLMGSVDDATWSWCYPCEQPVHEVTISNDFYMGQTEITQAQWLAVMGSWPGPSPRRDCGVGDNYPAYYISWYDCQNFITAVNQLGQGTFRLPSEAEWEYACRAGTTTRFCFGNSDCFLSGCTSCDLDNHAWWCGNSGSTTHPVGEKLPNGFGLFDMHGNVWEWCQDWYDSIYYGTSPSIDPTGPATGTYRVRRGGDWDYYAQYCRCASRSVSRPGRGGSLVGFRVVRTP